MKNKAVTFILATVILLVVWHIFSICLDKAFMPTPIESFKAFFLAIASGGLALHFGISAFRVAFSLILAMVLAVPLGLWMGQNERADSILAPFTFILYPIPKVVFLPVIVVLLGIGNAPKIFLITLVIFFQILVVARDASRAVPQGSLLSIRSLNATRMQTYRHVILPYCLPQILTSLRISLGTAIAILFFAETFASVTGIGYFILDAMTRRSYNQMFGGIIAMAILGLIAYAIVGLIERKFCRWQKI